MGNPYRALNVPATSAPLTFAQTSALGRGRSYNKGLKRESAHKKKGMTHAVRARPTAFLRSAIVAHIWSLYVLLHYAEIYLA